MYALWRSVNLNSPVGVNGFGKSLGLQVLVVSVHARLRVQTLTVEVAVKSTGRTLKNMKQSMKCCFFNYISSLQIARSLQIILNLVLTCWFAWVKVCTCWWGVVWYTEAAHGNPGENWGICTSQGVFSFSIHIQHSICYYALWCVFVMSDRHLRCWWLEDCAASHFEDESQILLHLLLSCCWAELKIVRKLNLFTLMF